MLVEIILVSIVTDLDVIRKILFPLIWLKQLPSSITKTLTNKLASITGADKPNRFKQWKLRQPAWKQFLIEVPVYLLILWILNLIFNKIDYQVTPW